MIQEEEVPQRRQLQPVPRRWWPALTNLEHLQLYEMQGQRVLEA